MAFAATGVENETNKGGWQRGFRGDHCVTLHGRTYHYLPGSRSHNPSGGLSYFVFDVPVAYEHLNQHATRINHGGQGTNSKLTTDIIRINSLI